MINVKDDLLASPTEPTLRAVVVTEEEEEGSDDPLRTY
jgi:hypothetical protein